MADSAVTADAVRSGGTVCVIRRGSAERVIPAPVGPEMSALRDRFEDRDAVVVGERVGGVGVRGAECLRRGVGGECGVVLEVEDGQVAVCALAGTQQPCVAQPRPARWKGWRAF